MTFWTRLIKVLFPKKTARMIDGREKRKRQLAFELQNLRIFEKRSLDPYTYSYCNVRCFPNKFQVAGSSVGITELIHEQFEVDVNRHYRH